MAGVDDHDALKAVLCYKPGNFLSSSLEDGVVGVHPVQVVVKEDHLEARRAASAFSAKTAFGIRCLNHEMRSSVSSTTRTGQSDGYGIARSCHTDSPSTVDRIDPSLYSFGFFRQKPVTSVMSGECRSAVVSVLDEGEQ